MTEKLYERMVVKARKLAQKIEGMSAEEYDKFMQEIIAKVRQLEQKMNKTQNKINHIDNLPYKRKLTAPKEILIHLASMIGLVGFDNFVLNSVHELIFSHPIDNEMLPYILITNLVILYPSYLGGKMNAMSYEEKPLTKYLEKLRKSVLQKKFSKIEDERLIWLYIHKHLKNAREEDILYPSTNQSGENLSKTNIN